MLEAKDSLTVVSPAKMVADSVYSGIFFNAELFFISASMFWVFGSLGIVVTWTSDVQVMKTAKNITIKIPIYKFFLLFFIKNKKIFPGREDIINNFYEKIFCSEALLNEDRTNHNVILPLR